MNPPATAPEHLSRPMRYFLLSAILSFAISVPSWSAPLPDNKSPSKITWKHGAIPAGDRFAGLTRDEWTEYFASRPRRNRPDSATRQVDETVVARHLGLSPNLVRKVRTERSVDYRRMLEFSPPLLARVFWRTHHPKRPDHPGEAAAFRALQQRSEDGQIVENGLPNAARQLEEMQENVRAGISPPFPGDPVPGEGPEVAGIDSTRWQALGPGNVPGRIRSAIIFPDSNIKVIGSVGGGIFRTTNGGQSWTAVNDFLANLAIGCMTQSPLQRDTIYAGTGEGFYNSDRIRGDGIFKSTDSGQTWTQLSATASNSSYRYVNRIAIDPNNVNILLAGTQTGIFRSTNAGTSWSATAGGGEAMDIDFHPTHSSFAVASGRNGNTWYSTDGGQNWTAATGIPSEANNRVEVAYAPSNGGVVYASCQRNSGELYRSTDSGVTYSLQNTGSSYLGGQGWYDNCLWVDPVNPDHLAVAGIDVWRSTNAGVNLTQISDWSQNSAGLSAHADHHILLSHPDYNGTTNREFYTGSDGGLAFTNDITTVAQTSGWTLLRNNIVTTQAYGGAGNPAGVFWLGTQDNGTPAYFGDSNGWTRHSSRSGDGGHCAADQLDANYLYGEYVYLTIYRSSNGGATATDIYSGITDADNSATAFFIAPFILDPNDQARMYAGGVQLWRTGDVKATPPTWASIKASNGNKISAIAVAPGNPNVIWVATSNSTITAANASEVFYTANGLDASPTWTQVDGNGVTLPNRYCSRIAIDPRDPAHVYVTFGGYNTNNLYVTSDTGTTWTNVNATANPALPTAPIRTVVFGNYSSDSVYVGTEVGIFASANAGAAWSPSQDGPANVSVDQLFWVGADTLYAATHGRGLWRISVPRPDTTTPAVDTTLPNFWYVNDTSMSGDSFTSAVGSDANHGLTRALPKRSLNALEGLLTSGDTVYIDAGFYYENDTFRIDTDSIWISGMDSLATVIAFNDTSTAGAKAIFAANRVNLTLRDFEVQRGLSGIWWRNVDSSRIERVRANANGGDGIWLDTGSTGGCDTNIMTWNSAAGNVSNGFRLNGSSNNTLTGNAASSGDIGIYLENAAAVNNTMTSNICQGNATAGIAINLATNNTASLNTLTGNATIGIYLLAASNNTFLSNVVSNNRSVGVYVADDGLGNGSSGNAFYLNTIDSNTNWAVDIDVIGTAISRNDTFRKNIIGTTPYSTGIDSAVRNATLNRFDFTRNYWLRGGVGTSDSSVIRDLMGSVGEDSILYLPFRLGMIDTAVGADTTAPKAPDTVASSILSTTSFRIGWSPVTALEEPNGGAVGLAGYRIYRSTRTDTRLWIRRGAVGASTLSFDDTGLSPDTGFYYRVTAVDAATYVNESFFSDSLAGGFTIDTSGPNVWYVNDTSTTGDSFTSAAGSIANPGLAITSPKRSLNDIEALLSEGDTVFVDAGVYYEADTFRINTDQIAIVGKDSNSTNIIFGNTTGSGFRSIYAGNRNRLVLRDFRISSARTGLYWRNVDSSTVERIRANGHGADGFDVQDSSKENRFAWNELSSNGQSGFRLDNQCNNTIIHGNTFDTNGIYGLAALGNDSLTVTSNRASNGGSAGIRVVFSSWSTISQNSIVGHSLGYNLSVIGGCTISNNSASASQDQGLAISSCSTSVITGNTVTGSQLDGIVIDVGCDTNTIVGNTSRDNWRYGFHIRGNGHRVTNNTSYNNASHGFLIASTNSEFVQNTADSNLEWAVFLDTVCAADTFARNNFLPPPGRDSGVRNDSLRRFEFSRNWWGSTDSVQIRARTGGVGRDSVIYSPFRLGLVDTTTSGDSIAPVDIAVASFDSTYTRIRLVFAASGSNEDGIGGAVAVGSYRIYRSLDSTISNWSTLIGSTADGDTDFEDSTALAESIYYYRVTARDSATFPNESFYSGIFAASKPRRTGDFGGNAVIDLEDVSLIGTRYHVPGQYNPIYDIGKNGVDGVIDHEDFMELGRRYGQ